MATSLRWYVSDDFSPPADHSFSHSLSLSFSLSKVASKLEHRGFRPWFDQWPGKGDATRGYIDVTVKGMQLGVKRSAVLILFLSKGVFTRPFCRLEIITALKEKRPILTLFETDPRHGAFDFGDASKDGVPPGFHPIVDKITSDVMSIPLRRDEAEQELMLDKISRIFIERRAKVLTIAKEVIDAAEETVDVTVDVDPSPTPEIPAKPPAASSSQHSISLPTSANYLTALNLHKHVVKFDAEGFESEGDLREEFNDEQWTIADLIANFSLPKPHAKKLFKFLSRPPSAQSGGGGASSMAPPPAFAASPTVIAAARGSGNTWDFFVSHAQAESGPQAQVRRHATSHSRVPMLFFLQRLTAFTFLPSFFPPPPPSL